MRSSMRVLVLSAVFATAFATTAVAMAVDSTWSNTFVNPDIVQSQVGLTELDVYMGDPGSGPGGNYDCSSDDSVKVDAEDIVVGASIAVGGGSVVITAFDGNELSWAIETVGTLDINQVIVKGGPAARLHTYSQTETLTTNIGDISVAGLADIGEGLRAPVNLRNGKNYGISNVSFCTDDKGGPAA